jgi:RIO kinase 1
LRRTEEKVRERLRLRERRQDFERRMRRKRSEEMDVLEEVFDKPTLMTVYALLNRGYLSDISGVLKSGKESRIYLGKGPGGVEVAVKIYLTTSAEFRQGMQKYIKGDPRFGRVSKGTKSLVYLWARKEFDNLGAAEEAGVRVPKRIAVEKNVVLMEFIGDNGVPAPLLREVPLTEPKKTFQRIVDSIARLYQKARIVHGDLSEYNIMMWKDTPVIFDLAQAIRPDHPMADTFLRRDITNVSRYFSSFGVETPSIEELHRQVVGKNGKQA